MNLVTDVDLQQFLQLCDRYRQHTLCKKHRVTLSFRDGLYWVEVRTGDRILATGAKRADTALIDAAVRMQEAMAGVVEGSVAP
jgi:hypothetical protein